MLLDRTDQRSVKGPKPDRRIRVSPNIRREEQQKLVQVGNQVERDLTRPPPQQQRRGPRLKR
jgi:hypothetical protein